MNEFPNLKLALAHDSFTQAGGAERVVEGLHKIFFQAPVFTLALDAKFKTKYGSWEIKTSKLQKFYNFLPKLRFWLPLIPWAVNSFKIEGFEAVLSSSSGFIKNLRLPKNCLHINYCHTPARFLWIDEDYVNQEAPFGLRWLVKLLLNIFKIWDLKGSQRVNFFIANSLEVQKRIKKIYGRESFVINPFIDCGFWRPTKQKADYFLIGGRLQAHKRNLEIVEIFNETGLELHVVGSGRQEAALKKIARPNVKFLGYLNDADLRDEYSGALALIFPQIEDFGLMPLEAAACGTASIGQNKGGSLETIVPQKTGELIEDFEKQKVKETILNWQVQKYKFEDLRKQAEKFSEDKFRGQMKNFVRKILFDKQSL